MSNWTISDKDEATEPKTAGERLAAARRAQDISIRDIAKELHLDEPKVRALEENRFDDLGAAVFAKGHLRKYAELVGVSVDDVLADYYAMNRSVGAPPVVGLPRKRHREIRLGPWVGAILLIAAVLAAGYWWFSREVPEQSDSDVATATSGVTEPIELPVAETVTTGPEAADADPAIQPAPDPVALDDVDDLAPAPQVVSRSLPSTGGPQVTLGMMFSGDCWTEVTGANGERLFFDLGRAGRRVFR